MGFYKMLSLSLLVSVITGCVDWVDDTGDLNEFVAEVNALPGGSIDPLPASQPYNSFVYEGASMREPFRAIELADPVEESATNKAEEVSDVKPDDNRVKDYLESFSIDRLVMVGTLNQRADSRLWALVQDENSEIHRVTIGDYIGLDHGEIISLDERQINLIEIIDNGRGGWMKRTRSLALNEPE